MKGHSFVEVALTAFPAAYFLSSKKLIRVKGVLRGKFPPHFRIVICSSTTKVVFVS